jgi:hypothetical protein
MLIIGREAAIVKIQMITGIPLIGKTDNIGTDTIVLHFLGSKCENIAFHNDTSGKIVDAKWNLPGSFVNMGDETSFL